MSEPMEMAQARSVYTRIRENFRRELLHQLRQYDSCPHMTFEIKQHLRLRALDLKPECLESYRQDTRKIQSNQLPLMGNSLRLRSLCTTETSSSGRSGSGRKSILDDDDGYEMERSRRTGISSLPLNKLTYESNRRATTNTHVLAFERQLVEDMDRIIDSIDQLSDYNRNDWLQPSKQDRQRQYFNSLYDDTTYSMPLFSTANFTLQSALKDDDWRRTKSIPASTVPGTVATTIQSLPSKEDKTLVERFYENYLSNSEYLNNKNGAKTTTKAGGSNKFADDDLLKTSSAMTRITSNKDSEGGNGKLVLVNGDFYCEDFPYQPTASRTSTLTQTRTSRRFLYPFE